VQDSKTTLSIDLLENIEIFLDQFGDELDACHPAAFDEIYQVLVENNTQEERIRKFLSDFYFEYGDELEGCNEEAYSNIVEILKKYEISL
jgi:hypothetical protein